jgi:hypothetical protein
MAKWARRGRRRRSAAASMYWYSDRAWGDSDDDGAADGVGRPGCGDEMAPQSELASCAPVVLEAGDAKAGEAAGQGGPSVETGAVDVV